MELPAGRPADAGWSVLQYGQLPATDQLAAFVRGSAARDIRAACAARADLLPGKH